MAAAAHAKERFSILLVDDDPTVIRILSRILCDYAPLRFATSGHVALKLAREIMPDLVLLDVEMPEFTGFEICKAFKADARLASIPIIFITSHEGPQLEAAGLQLGGADFIAKPPHAALVLARVRTYQQLKAMSDTVRSAVTMDFATGAMTRRHMEKTLAQEWLRSQRSHSPLSLVLVDIDGFTAVNNAFGEEAGDACLRFVAEALRAVAHRPTDLLARHGGGKFALLLPETSHQGAVSIAGRALDAIADLSGVDPAGGRRITVSLGGATKGGATNFTPPGTAGGPPPGGVPDDLLAAAEMALRSAKTAGGHHAEFVEIGAFDLKADPPHIPRH